MSNTVKLWEVPLTVVSVLMGLSLSSTTLMGIQLLYSG